jgi:hypothetical protein
MLHKFRKQENIQKCKGIIALNVKTRPRKTIVIKCSGESTPTSVGDLEQGAFVSIVHLKSSIYFAAQGGTNDRFATKVAKVPVRNQHNSDRDRDNTHVTAWRETL